MTVRLDYGLGGWSYGRALLPPTLRCNSLTGVNEIDRRWSRRGDGLLVCIYLLALEHEENKDEFVDKIVLTNTRLGLMMRRLVPAKASFIAGIDSLIDKATRPERSTDFARSLAPDNFPARASNRNGAERNRTATGITVRINQEGTRRYSSISGVRRGNLRKGRAA